MSDATESIHRSRHGEGAATFICTHLKRGIDLHVDLAAVLRVLRRAPRQ